jgi:hypothetical protein
LGEGSEGESHANLLVTLRLQVKAVQHAMNDWRRNDADRDDHRETAVESIQPREHFAVRAEMLLERPHA